MRKRKVGYKFSRDQGARKALYRSLVSALVKNNSMITTKIKAKFVQKKIEKIINIANADTISARRLVYSELGNNRVTTEDLFKKIIPIFKGKKGGYTRIIPLAKRRGDASDMARIEWSEEIEISDKKKVTRVKSKSVKKDMIEKEAKRKLSLKEKLTKKTK
ncbi:50S ribosomal protein L17 [Candidatus Woesebacteria bacterium RBG_16_34_12]|uniref:50S ribosomal protein L17 n=1 Tax=Candidatus Woesebacteria bacterium RBG_16_34_12 TaxID=1802480 RepID=A0A1F7X991_9BACT|nr:MAG: 50S ribosomal protein L17 [Candidatus Woesebacteria bacterium RBG_16_34_12]